MDKSKFVTDPRLDSEGFVIPLTEREAVPEDMAGLQSSECPYLDRCKHGVTECFCAAMGV
jgi:hypothetical protein